MKKSKFDIRNIYLYAALIILIIILLNQKFNIYSVILCIPIFFLTYFLSKKSKKFFPFILLFIAFFIRLFFVLKLDTPVISDFKVILNTARELLNGNNIMNHELYFFRYGYQTGPVLYTYLFLKIFDSVTFLKIINCIFSSLNCLIIYFIGKKIASDRSAKFISLLYAFFPFSVLFNTVLSNQIPGSTFFYLGILILLYFRKNIIVKYILVALLFGIGNFLRSEGIIFVCAIIGFHLINCLTNKEERKNKIQHLSLIVFVSVYFLFGILTNSIIKYTHINNEGLSNNFTEWKFILGLNTSTCGGYNDADIVYMVDKNTAQNEIVNRLKSLTFQSTIELVTCKAKKTWSSGTLYWTFLNLSNKNYSLLGYNFTTNDLNIILSSLNEILYYFVFIFLIIGLVSFKNNKCKNNYIFIFINVLAINFIVYSLIEVQPRYNYLLHISIFILATIGLDKLWSLKK